MGSDRTNHAGGKHILVVLGTRPEVVKLAPVIRRLQSVPGTEITVCATGQHRELFSSAVDDFGVQVDIDLEVMRHDQNVAELFALVLQRLNALFVQLRPDTILVQGDTTTAAAAALAGFLGGVTVAHVEAGLRTRDKRAPFPEEIHRRVAGLTADLHFAPTDRARKNLIAEGVPAESVFVTGNTVVDALLWMRDRLQNGAVEDTAARVLERTGTGKADKLVLVTAHRRENFGTPLREICLGIRDIAIRHADVRIVYPVHLNPSVQRPVRHILGDCERVHLIEPVEYRTLVGLLMRAHFAVTDSGGIQEEAPALGVPLVVLREKTERPEAVEAGMARLVGASRERLVAEASRLLGDPEARERMARPVNLYGDGQAARRIADVLATGVMATPPFTAAAAPAEQAAPA